MPKITPFLWFDNQAEAAANFYISVFKNGKIGKVTRQGGKVLVVEFEVNGQQFLALNGGPQFKFTEAVSFVVHCETQDEVDEYWTKLSQGGSEMNCGWVKDKYGLSWQIVPTALGKLMSDPDPQKSQAVFQAMMKMNKIVIADLQRAHEAAA